MAILNNKYKKWSPCAILRTDEVWDFILSKDNSESISLDRNLTTRCLSAYVDINDDECVSSNNLYSKDEFVWDESVNNSVVAKNIGFTGIDNGLITYNRGVISNEDFLNILTKSKIEMNQGKKLVLHSVTGNTGTYSYDFSLENDGLCRYAKLKGGFFQGFFKLDGYDYQVLPSYLEDTWHMEFVIRPRDYEEKFNTLNCTHPQNNGIFFYMGTRAENKFLQFYDYDFSKYEKRNVENENSLLCEKFYDGYYFMSESEEDDLPENEIILTPPSLSDFKKLLAIFYLGQIKSESNCNPCLDCENPIEEEVVDNCKVIDKEYFIDDYAVICQQEYFDENYIKKEIDLNSVEILDSNGNSFNTEGYYEIETDNKFLIFNNTKGGFNTKTWDDNFKFVLTGVSQNRNDNLFLLLNRSKTGYTTDTIERYYQEYKKYEEPNLQKDITNNSFALKIEKDGSIGYRYLIHDCDYENNMHIEEEYSFPNIITPDEWNVINVKCKIINNGSNECGVNINNVRKMRIYIYVNGFLKLVSKELPEFIFRRLDETFDKQEGVPFNISLGGGTQGLCESVWIDYYKPFEWILPLEKYFAGTFIGDFKSFKFYDCELEFNEIKNNLLYERLFEN